MFVALRYHFRIISRRHVGSLAGWLALVCWLAGLLVAICCPCMVICYPLEFYRWFSSINQLFAAGWVSPLFTALLLVGSHGLPQARW